MGPDSANGSYIISTQPLDDHVMAVQRFGPGPPAPGWYAHAGFRTSVDAAPVVGPEPDLMALRRAWLWQLAERDRGPYVPGRSLDLGVHGHGWMGGDIAIYDPVIVLHPEGLYLCAPCRIDAFVKLECGGGILVGRDVHVAAFCHLGIGSGRVILEDGSSFGSGAKIISGSNTYGLGHGCSAIAADATVIRSFVHIGKNATLYAGAIVLPGVTVGENAVIAAGAVVTKDVPAREIWGGVPARRIGVVQ